MPTSIEFFKVELSDNTATVVQAGSKAAAYLAAIARYPANEAPLSRRIVPVRPIIQAKF